MVEVEYFIALCKAGIPALSDILPEQQEELRAIYSGFSVGDAEKVKEIEKVTNHDVKAVEYFVKEQFELLGLDAYKEFIHLAETLLPNVNFDETPFQNTADGLEQTFVGDLINLIATEGEAHDR